MRLRIAKYTASESEDWRKKYNYVGDFSKGLAQVKLNGKWGFVNEKGEIVIPLKYDEVGDFSKGLASVGLKGKWGFVKHRGRHSCP